MSVFESPRFISEQKKEPTSNHFYSIMLTDQNRMHCRHHSRIFRLAIVLVIHKLPISIINRRIYTRDWIFIIAPKRDINLSSSSLFLSLEHRQHTHTHICPCSYIQSTEIKLMLGIIRKRKAQKNTRALEEFYFHFIICKFIFGKSKGCFPFNFSH